MIVRCLPRHERESSTPPVTLEPAGPIDADLRLLFRVLVVALVAAAAVLVLLVAVAVAAPAPGVAPPGAAGAASGVTSSGTPARTQEVAP